MSGAGRGGVARWVGGAAGGSWCGWMCGGWDCNALTLGHQPASAAKPCNVCPHVKCSRPAF